LLALANTRMGRRSAPALSRAMRRPLIAILTLGLLAPAAASADSTVNLLRDCQDGRINGSYSQAQFQRALNSIGSDVDEYTDCRDVIRRAQLAAAGARKGSGGGGGSSGASGSGTAKSGAGASPSGASGGGGSAVRADPLAAATPKERAAVAQAGSGGGQPVEVAGQLVTPGAVGDLSGAGRDLPTPVLVLLALLGVTALGGGGWFAWTRVHARRTG
jgi:hypothetical protein